MISLLKIRKNLIIQRIIIQRNDSAKIIQKKYKKYVSVKNLFNLSLKHKKFYSVYPSKENFSSISIKIFTDLRNPTKFKILPLKFCSIRNTYVFDIPKSKFTKNKKIMRFNFIIDDEVTVDTSYDYVLFGDCYVNQIDFKEYDNKIENNFKKFDESLKEKSRKNLRNKKKYLKDDDENNFVILSHEKSKLSFDGDSDEDFACINLPTPVYVKKTVRQMYKTNLTKKNLSKSNEFISITTNESTFTLQNMIFSENEGNDNKRSGSKKTKKVRTNSILKKRNESRESGLNYLSKSSDSILKKVSFGTVKYSY